MFNNIINSIGKTIGFSTGITVASTVATYNIISNGTVAAISASKSALDESNRAQFKNSTKQGYSNGKATVNNIDIVKASNLKAATRRASESTTKVEVKLITL